jgi:FtsP/CotA-like multicopper oxidase with cupredoxin domain
MSSAKERLAMRPSLLKVRALLVGVVTTASLVLVSSATSAAPVSIDLCAVSGTATLPGAVVAPIWGFGAPAVPGDCLTAIAGIPGPVLSVDQGDVVTINVTNALPAGTPDVPHVVSIEIPGMTFDPGAIDAAVGATASVTFTATRPGTYLYQSSGDGGRQLGMGLYGALIVRPATPNQAYDDATTAYDVEATLVLSQLDPAFNAAPDTFDMRDYLATYWLINGQAYPMTPPIAAPAGQRLLLRYLNAGYDNTSMMLLGMRERVLAKDARLLNDPYGADAELIPSGATEDAIATVPVSAPPSANGFALYNRQLHVTNGTAASAVHSPGGMLTFIQP